MPFMSVRCLFCMAVIVIMAMLVAVIARCMVVIMTMVMGMPGLAGRCCALPTPSFDVLLADVIAVPRFLHGTSRKPKVTTRSSPLEAKQ